MSLHTRIQLSDHFTFKKLLRFAAAPIFMMIFTSVYGVVDGFFVSNFAGKTPFAAINLIMPFLMVLGSLGFMIGTGGTAIISMTLGRGNKEDANKYFSLLVYVTAIGGIVFSAAGELALPAITRALKATEDMYDYCIFYGRIILIAIPFFMLQNVFQAFFSTAEKPTLGFLITLIAGCTNILLDGILVGVFKTGVKGAAIATAVSQFVGAAIPLIYFFSKNNSLLRLGRPKWNGKVLLRTCTNGLSEFVNNISASVVSIIFNYQLLRLAGENGVSAYGVIMYVTFIFFSIYVGYAIGTAPLIGFNYGANNEQELKNIFKKSMIVMGLFGITLIALSLANAAPIAKLYVGYDAALYALTKRAFYIYSFCFLTVGYSIFGSSMFTAFNNGLISAIISFLRTLVIQTGFVFVLPLIWGLNGVWFSMLFAEILASLISISCFIAFRKRYKYA
ncbi:MAG: MATE family efflux transporter [Clostridiales bacterium]|nr:MATE family efflux transporter [Clostridiales bacterium]